jgi:hypothetical protein
MTDKQNDFDELMKRFDEQMKLFFDKAKRGRRLLQEISEDVSRRNEKMKANK